MTVKIYTVKSNARRDARKQGLDPDLVVAVDGGFIISAPITSHEPGASTHRADGKGANLLARLRQDWTPAPDLATEYGWLPHTLRGAISTLAKKTGVVIERRKVDGVTSYRVAP